MKFYTNVYKHGRKILVRGYENGERFQKEVTYSPYFFVNPPKREEPSCQFFTIKGKPLKKIDFEDMYSSKEYLARYEEVDNFPIYGSTSYAHTYIFDEYKGQIEHNPSLISVVNIDIETSTENGFPNIEEADKAIVSISLCKNNKFLVLGLKPYENNKDNVTYILCKDEYDLLKRFLVVWESAQWNPDVVTGWNIEAFDIPYIVKRVTKILGEQSMKRLSPWKIMGTRKAVLKNGKEIHVFVPAGIAVLDYMLLYKKFSYSPQESYALNHIAQVELGAKKLDWQSKHETMHDFYINDHQMFIDYNIHDVWLVDQLEEKLGFLKQVFALAYDAKVNYIDTYTTVRIWDVIIHNHLLEKNIVIPPLKTDRFNEEDDEKIEGAHVKDPKPGMYDWVVSFDLDSLYPHLIMQYNISPETFVERMEGITVDQILQGRLNDPTLRNQMEAQNITFAASGASFDRDHQGFLAELMEKIYKDRSVWKSRMIEAKKEYEETPTKELEYEIARCKNMQMAKKILLNSAYGALANKYYRWYQQDLAESITMSGQLSIRWVENKMNDYLNKVLKTDNIDYVIAIDTDSMYVHLGPLVEKMFPNGESKEKIVSFLNKLSETKLNEIIHSGYEELAVYVNAYQQKMRMKREAIADKGIWTGKKHYILNVYDLEGVRYKEPELKVQGIEAVRSSTPSVVRDAIKKAVKLIMTTDEATVKQFVRTFKEEFKRLPFEEVAFPRGVRGLGKWGEKSQIFKKGCPIHVRGALLYNHFIKIKNLEGKLPSIGENEKVKFSYLLTPNPIMQNVISTPGALPKEFDLNTYIDYDTQLEKAFLSPLDTILNVIDWSIDDRATLEDFFV